MVPKEPTSPPRAWSPHHHTQLVTQVQRQNNKETGKPVQAPAIPGPPVEGEEVGIVGHAVGQHLQGNRRPVEAAQERPKGLSADSQTTPQLISKILALWAVQGNALHSTCQELQAPVVLLQRASMLLRATHDWSSEWFLSPRYHKAECAAAY